ncbi:hypothetical protein LOTGIDRAFT_155096 [Lottia gigantea]|uniref:Uncharacterized protein n=1 Tax=Lottia gigantea TaxID=225164 RepID=V3Z4J6_LOTGI|nr:hypothetical protein LOTGIDRAFT_155096 [Lottia gigantea]ESO85608.1 hypothetical protein LOTGIDRAFT_155096 [Lottia gigantea]
MDVEDGGIDFLDSSLADNMLNENDELPTNCSFSAIDDILPDLTCSEEQMPNLVKHRISRGRYSITSDNPLSVRYYEKKSRTLWLDNEADYLINQSDILAKIKPPELSLCGTRVYYEFPSVKVVLFCKSKVNFHNRSFITNLSIEIKSPPRT